MNESNGTGWSLATAFWVLIGVGVAIALGVWLVNVGNNKAELAAEISRINGVQGALTVQVEKNTTEVGRLAPAVSRVAGELSDLQNYSHYNVEKFYGDLYAPRPYQRCPEPCGCNGNSRFGGDSSRYARTDSYELKDSTLSFVDVCTKC
ncbi:MAG: hypothetical protein R3Y08_08320 [Rikenellaceae bacterium]